MDQGELAWRSSGVGGDPPDFRKASAALALALLALNILDIAVTNLVVSDFGAVELNPLMAPLIGTPWSVVLKIGIPLGIVVMTTRSGSVRLFGLLRVVVGVYVVIAIVNVGQAAIAVS
jgi:hypothetical protein